MVIFTETKKNSGTIFSFLKAAFTLSFFLLSSFFLNAQQVNGIITDFGGYWRSDSASLSSVYPNTSHNVVAFKVGSTIYSTGINNALLSSKSITYTAGNFKSLPITSISGTVPGPPVYIALAANYDGVANGFSSPPPTVKMKDVLTDGLNGLDIGTGVTNIPSSAVLTFPVQSIDISSIADAKPDILYTQIADPTVNNALDTVYFANAAGVIVGHYVTVNWATVPSLGTYTLDLYNLQAGATCNTATITGGFNSNTTRNIRLTSFKLSDFGITAANAPTIAFLLVKPGGESDPAFMAYNTDAFVITPPVITSQPQTTIVCAGSNQSATFSVTATGTGNTYQWRKDGVDIPGATGSTYTINPVTTASAGTYEVVVTNSAGSVTSNKAYLNTEITQQPAGQTIVTGNSLTLSVTATNATAYQWKKNGVDIASATNSTYTINPVTTTDSGSYTVSVINSASNGCATVLSNAAVVTPAIVVYSKSVGNINVASTWGANTDGSGSAPVDFTRAEHTFVLSNRATASTLTNLTIAGTLDVKDGIAIITDNTTLDVGKCIRSGTGSISASTAAGLTVRGNSNLYFTSGYQYLKSFTITGGTVNMLSNLTIAGGVLPGKLNLTGGTLALGSNKITLASSSPLNTSIVTAVGATASITYGTGGGFVAERYIIGKRSYRFISPCVTTTTSIKRNWMEGVSNPDRWTNYNPNPGYGTHITGPKTAADSLDVTQTYNPSLFTFDKTNQTWNAVPNSAGTLTAGSPYRFMIRGSRSVDLNNNDAIPSATIIRATGVLTTGTYNVPSSLLSTRVGGYSFIGNPYASPVDWGSLTKSGVSSSYYTWDESLNTRGAFVSYNLLSAANSNTLSLVDQNIQAGQAFLVMSTSTTPSITFKESDKTSTNTSVFRETNTLGRLSVQLLLNNNAGVNNTADGFTAVYSDDFSKAIGDEDAYKFTNLDENIAISRNGTMLSIEGRPNIINSDTLPIKIWQFRQKTYLLKIDGKNFSPQLSAVLKDEYLKQDTPVDLSSSTLIPFDITSDSASFAPNRFSIIFKGYSVLPITVIGIQAYEKDKGIQVEWTTIEEANVAAYELEKSTDGQHFDKAFTIHPKGDVAASHNYSWCDAYAAEGNNFYRIKIVQKDGTVKYSAIARVNISKHNADFSVFPNPVKDGVVSMHLKNMKKGTYTVQLFNGLGQQVHTGSIEHNGGSASKTLQLNGKIDKGEYVLQLSNEDGALSQKIIVQ